MNICHVARSRNRREKTNLFQLGRGFGVAWMSLLVSFPVIWSNRL